MPQVVAGWVIAAVGATGIAAAAITAGVALAFNYAVAKIFAPKGPRAKDLQTEVRSPDPDRVRLLGRNKVSGAVMFYEWAEVGGIRVLFKLMAVAQGGFTGIDAWWLNDKQVTVAGSGTVTTDPWANKVRLYAIAQGNGGAYGGSLAASFPGQWTSNHRLTGIGTVLAEFNAVGGEDIPDTYPGGDPTVTVLLRGDALYNPVTETYAYGESLPVQLRDILTHPRFGSLKGGDLDNASWSQAIADAADPIQVLGVGNLPRYHGGGGYALKEPMKDVAQRWLDGMAGTLYTTTEGKIGLRVGKWREPNFTITEDKVVSFKMGRGSGELDRITTLHPKYTAPQVGWVETVADPWDDVEALDRYGEVLPKEMPVPVVQHHGHARRLAKIKIAKLNPRWRFEMRLRFWGLLLLEEETVNVHMPRLGIINQPFWIDGYGFDPESGDGPCSVRLVHARPESFSWTAATEEGSPPATPGDTSYTGTLAVAILSGFEVVRDNGLPFIRITITPPAARTPIAQYRRHGSTDPWTSMQPEGEGSVLRTFSLEDQSEYDVRYGLRRFKDGVVDGVWQYISAIEVFANLTPPSAPILVSASGTAGGTHEFVFKPDLGVNYALTRFYIGTITQSFPDAALIGVNRSQADVVTVPGNVPPEGARYWMQSENESGFKSPAVEVIEVLP